MIGKSSLNSAEPLRSSDAAKDVTANSVDGASRAALDRGFTRVPLAEAAEEAEPMPPMTRGFLGRARGWER